MSSLTVSSLLLMVLALHPLSIKGDSSNVNSTCQTLEWGQEGEVNCTSQECDPACQVGCGPLLAIFSNGMFSSTAEAAAGCELLQECPPQSDAAVNILGTLFATMVLDEYSRKDGPMPAVWESYGIENITSINVEGWIRDPLLAWGVGTPSEDEKKNQIQIGAEASVLESPTDVFVVVRGSEAQLADWSTTNANVAKVRMENLGGQKVHKGFMTHAMALEPQLTQVLGTINAQAAFANITKALWFTGHSMGGAVAVLLADFYDLQYLGPLSANEMPKWANLALAGVYTFGAPKSGDAEFAAAYNAALGALTHRFVTRDANLSMPNLDHKWDDYVTMLPLTITLGSYSHVGRYRGIFAEARVGDNSSDYFALEFDSDSLPTSVKDALAILEANAEVVIQRHSKERYALDLSNSVLTHAGVGDKDLCVYTATVHSMLEEALVSSPSADNGSVGAET